MEQEGKKTGILMLVDTSIFIDAFRNHPPAVAFFESVENDRVLFSAVTETELVAGAYCANRTVKIDTLQFLSDFRKIPVDNRIAVLAGDLRREHGISLPDAFIAATAIAHQAVVVTKNVRDFSRVVGLGVQEPY